MISKHYEAMLQFYGPVLGGRVARKHLGWYMDDAATPSVLRKMILTSKNPSEVLRLLQDAIPSVARGAA